MINKLLPVAITGLFLLILPSILFAQTRQISGIVRNTNGEPIASVSINEVGTTRGTSTNNDGTFSLQISGSNVSLEISAIGYKSSILKIGNESNFQIILKENEAASMEEVVVTALGITRQKKALGYASQEVKGENLTMTKDQNVIGALAGKIAGVQVIGSSGANLGGTQKIKIRGINSIGGGGAPLIVVDGTPISNANFSSGTANGTDLGNIGQDINNDDIESINVLKGPPASALYGLRGQYGVVLITTKKGSRAAKKATISLNSA